MDYGNYNRMRDNQYSSRQTGLEKGQDTTAFKGTTSSVNQDDTKLGKVLSGQASTNLGVQKPNEMNNNSGLNNQDNDSTTKRLNLVG